MRKLIKITNIAMLAVFLLIKVLPLESIFAEPYSNSYVATPNYGAPKILLPEPVAKESPDPSSLVMTLENMSEDAIIATIEYELVSVLKEQREIYHEYIYSTERDYKQLENALGIDKEFHLTKYAILSAMTPGARRKIAVDFKLETLRRKGKATLTQREKQAMRIDLYTLQPLREACIEKLENATQAFASTIKSLLGRKPSLYISSDEEHLSALFLLNKKDTNSR